MDLWLANPFRPAPPAQMSAAALDMLSPRPNPLEPPDADEEAEDDAYLTEEDKPVEFSTQRGPFDLVFAVGVSLALWALIALIVILFFF